MESLPLVPKSNILPNPDTTSIIRHVFQKELESHVPTRKLSENIWRSLEYRQGEEESFNSVEYLENLLGQKDNLIEFAENVLEAYKTHETSLDHLAQAELNILQSQARCLKRERFFAENESIREWLKLKRRPFLTRLDDEYVKKYCLLQGDVGLPARHIANVDFRVKEYKTWNKRLESMSPKKFLNFRFRRKPSRLPPIVKQTALQKGKDVKPENKKQRRPRLKKSKPREKLKPVEVFQSVPKMVFFTGYSPGDIYEATIAVRNVSTVPMKFNLEPRPQSSPFRVNLCAGTMRILPGLFFKLEVEFKPKSLDDVHEDVRISLEDGSHIDIPLVAYLEPPLLKTHEELDEYTDLTAERISSSYIECGPCLSGNSSAITLRFYAFGGPGEFCIMSYENWSRNDIDTISTDNTVEIQPFRVFPAYFKLLKDEAIDIYVEFMPESSGMHAENIILACNNGEVRSLDLLADGIAWHRYYFTFQDSLLKDLPVDEDDDDKAVYSLYLGDTLSTGRLQKSFWIANHSNMAFDFRWEMRDSNVNQTGKDPLFRLQRSEVRVEPPCGTFASCTIREFVVTVNFIGAFTGKYRTVLSFYIVNLPHDCIEELDTVIRPTVTKEATGSQTLVDEEECALFSPRLSMQKTFESLQESIKLTNEQQQKAQCSTRQDMSGCRSKPSLSSNNTFNSYNTSLKKSKTYVNIGEGIDEEAWCCLSRSRESTQYDPDGCPIPMFDADLCGVHVKEDKLDSITEESLWDFVDVLVDEVELFAEVTSTNVILQPCVLQICGSMKIGNPSARRHVKIFNYNKVPVLCKWFQSSEQTPEASTEKEEEGKEDEDPCLCGHSTDVATKGRSCRTNTITSVSKQSMFTNLASTYDLAQISTTEASSLSVDEEILWKKHELDVNPRSHEITVLPYEEFVVPPLSEFSCYVSISVTQSGVVRDFFKLSVNNGDLLLDLLILAEVDEKGLNVSDSLIDFGIVTKGSQRKHGYTISNEMESDIVWQLSQYKFDFNEGKLIGPVNLEREGNIKCGSGFLCHKGSFFVDNFVLDGRKSGLYCSLLQIGLRGRSIKNSPDKFIVIIGDVKSPKLSLEAPRFENAILAPAGMMYVGQKVTKKVTLRNLRRVSTWFCWGHAFGCHCRRLKLDISPKCEKIGPLDKVFVTVDITPLDEGIIEHCYVPCFFGKTEEPIILSVVGIAEKLNVTFELINSSGKSHRTMSRLRWPFKVYDPNLKKKFLHEDDILEMRCQCADVDKEARRAFGKEDRGKDMESLSHPGISKGEDSPEESRKATGEDHLDADLTPKSQVQVDATERKVHLAIDTVQQNTFKTMSLEALEYVKCTMDFLNVPCRTAARRQFVIRNETPIATNFKIVVQNFGEMRNLRKKNEILETKYRIMGNCSENWQDRLAEDQPLMIAVEPDEGELLGLDAVIVSVWVYGDTWGEYRDVAVVKINGISDFHLKIFVRMIGHPIAFPMFQYHEQQTPILRFGPFPFHSNPVTRSIRVQNTSSVPLIVTWMTFVNSPVLEQEEESEDVPNSFTDMCANLESSRSPNESTKSIKEYLPKNTSESPPNLRGMCTTEASEYSKQTTTSRSAIEKLEESSECEDALQTNDKVVTTDRASFPGSNFSDVFCSTKPEVHVLANYGRADVSIFQVDPKELHLEAHGEKKMSITFKPDTRMLRPLHDIDFKASLTGCVRLQPEHSVYPGIYLRHCGKEFVSHLLTLTARWEVPVLEYEILKEDLTFHINANDVIRSRTQKITFYKCFVFKNKSQAQTNVKLHVRPGLMIRVRMVRMIGKKYTQYDPQMHDIKVEPGEGFEVELECTATSSVVLQAFRQLRGYPTSHEEPGTPISKRQIKDSLTRMSNHQGENESFRIRVSKHEVLSTKLKEKFAKSLMNENESKNEFVHEEMERMEEEQEIEGTSSSSTSKGEDFEHAAVISETIDLEQPGLLKQSLRMKLKLYFPMIRASPSSVDFGQVYINETACRHFSLINMTGSPTPYNIHEHGDTSAFSTFPKKGSLPATNYNSDIGRSVTVQFTPPQPGVFRQVLRVFCNEELMFDKVDVEVCGQGTWDEMYRNDNLKI